MHRDEPDKSSVLDTALLEWESEYAQYELIPLQTVSAVLYLYHVAQITQTTTVACFMPHDARLQPKVGLLLWKRYRCKLGVAKNRGRRRIVVMHLVRKYNPFKRSVVDVSDSLTSSTHFSSTVTPSSGRQSTAASAAAASSAGKRSKAEKELQHLSCKIVSQQHRVLVARFSSITKQNCLWLVRDIWRYTNVFWFIY